MMKTIIMYRTALFASKKSESLRMDGDRAEFNYLSGIVNDFNNGEHFFLSDQNDDSYSVVNNVIDQ